jgi:hypothetical protein
MPFETPFPPALFAGTITAVEHEHGGVTPPSIIRTDQSWAVNVSWTTTGLATGMICGDWHLHLYLESIGPGPDLDLIDAVNPGHIIPLTPGLSPVGYFVHFDVFAGNGSPGGSPLQISRHVDLLRRFRRSWSDGCFRGRSSPAVLQPVICIGWTLHPLILAAA